MSMTQQTLTGEETDEPRTRPQTMLWCPVTEEYVLRSRREEYPHELIEQSERDVTEEVEGLSEDCNIETQTYRVEFVDECREVVHVEASNKSEAKWVAEEERTYDSEYIDNLHTRTEDWGEKSLASIEYLEVHGLLPDDHDVTPADLERLADQ